MYQPAAFTVDDRRSIGHLLRDSAFGHLVSVDEDGRPQSSSVPFVVDDEVTTLRAHLARANRHWRSLDGAEALMIVAGPDAYVSPRWYPSKQVDGRVVPTWNYELVHLRGTVRLVDDPAGKLAIVEAMTSFNEDRSVAPGEDTWAVGDAPDDFVAAQLRAIVGLELTITEVEAKRKLSQNRAEADQAGTVAGLAARGDRGSTAVAEAMGTIGVGSAQGPEVR